MKSFDSSDFPTILALDPDLINEAQRVGGHATRKQAVAVALREYIERRKQLAVLDLFGTIDFDPSYNFRRNRMLDRVEGKE